MKHRRLLAIAGTLSTLVLLMAVGAVIWAIQAESQRRRIDQANASLEQTNRKRPAEPNFLDGSGWATLSASSFVEEPRRWQSGTIGHGTGPR
jgi:hypothetical protein